MAACQTLPSLVAILGVRIPPMYISCQSYCAVIMQTTIIMQRAVLVCECGLNIFTAYTLYNMWTIYDGCCYV